jgi:hypothetical protein
VKFYHYFDFVAPINRVLTLYIAVNRACIVGSFSQASRHLHKTERDHIKETVLFGILPGVVVGIASIVIRAKVDEDSVSIKYLTVSQFFTYLIFNVVMASLAFYIIIKTHRQIVNESGKVMQKNVAAVAIVFCICHVPYLIVVGKLAFPSDMITIPFEVASFSLALNSTCNLIIYLALGKTFRRRLFDVLTECRQRGGSRGGRRGRRTVTQGTPTGCQGIALTATREVPEGREAGVDETTF